MFSESIFFFVGIGLRKNSQKLYTLGRRGCEPCRKGHGVTSRLSRRHTLFLGQCVLNIIVNEKGCEPFTYKYDTYHFWPLLCVVAVAKRSIYRLLRCSNLNVSGSIPEYDPGKVGIKLIYICITCVSLNVLKIRRTHWFSTSLHDFFFKRGADI